MNNYKIEITIDNIYLEELLEILDEEGVHGYTGFDIDRSKGVKHGERLSKALIPTSRKSYIFSIVQEEIADHLVQHLEEFLSDRGGIMIQSKVDRVIGIS